MTIKYIDCITQENVFVNYEANDEWVFIPEKISVAGRSVNLSPSAPAGFVYYGTHNGYHIIARRGNTRSASTLGACPQIGNSYPVNYTYPEINFFATIPKLQAGKYQGTIPVRFAYAEHHGVYSDNITKFSDSLALQYSTISNIPYSINITNSCFISSRNISLDHGSLSTNTANGNTSLEKVSINCDSATSLKVSLKAVTIPIDKYSDGVGVGLGYLTNS
ncbi:hypothetical protein FRK02_21400 [Salmonella enterica]|nr:hypothetical protein [Salmonella enterica]